MGVLDDIVYKFSNPADRKKAIAGSVLGVCVLTIILGVAIGVPLSKKSNDTGDEYEQRARNVLQSVPLIDGHNDFPWQLFGNIMNQLRNLSMEQDLRVAWDPSAHGIPSMTDIPRLQEGLLGAQFWVAYVRCNTQGVDAVRLTLEQIDVIKRMINKYPQTFEYVTSAQGIEDAFAAGKIGSLIGVEGGHSIDSSLATLRMMYELGVRYMTLTHSCNTPWCDNWLVDLDDNPDPATSNGLSDFGKLVIKEMNRLGMLIDLSHTSVKAQEDTLALTTAPVIYSHSSAYELCNSKRNVPDHVLDKVKENEGIVMVNFYNLYVTCNRTGTTLADVADHIQYMRDGWGAEIVGIGSDYDGVQVVPEGLEDVSTYPALFTELARRGFTDEEMGQIAGNNLLRVLRKAEQVRDSLADIDPYEDYIPEEDVKNQTCRLTFNEAANIAP